GYALLALIIVLAVLAMLLASSVNTFHADTMRDKEDEFIFRGYEMAKAIARYNNAGKLAPLHLGSFPLALEDIGKQAEINGVRFCYVRKFALVDPITNDEWKPIRAGDPLIGEYLSHWAEYYGQTIPPSYYQLSGGTISNPAVSSPNPPKKGGEDEDDDDDDDDDDEDTSSNSTPGTGQNGSGFQKSDGGSVSAFGQTPVQIQPGQTGQIVQPGQQGQQGQPAQQGQMQDNYSNNPTNGPFVKFDEMDEDQ